MTEDEIFQKLQKILVEKLKCAAIVRLDTALLNDKILDSMDFMNYLTWVENEFHVKISDEDLSQYRLGIVGNMVDFLQKHV